MNGPGWELVISRLRPSEWRSWREAVGRLILHHSGCGNCANFGFSDETIRQLTESAGQEVDRWLLRSEGAIENLKKANGNVEFYTDGTSVNTRQGWREMRLSVWASVHQAIPPIPRNGTRVRCPNRRLGRLSAGVQSSEELGPQWSEIARRLGLGQGFGVSVLADGARWIWKQVAAHLPRGGCVVDVYHVSEHLHACGRSLYGDHTPQARCWAEARLATVLRAGPMELLRELQQAALVTPPEAGGRKALEGLIEYLKPNIDGLWYRDRLKRGLAIGSGMVEGACKTVVGRRLKCNDARRKVENADRLASLCCLLYCEQWASFWAARAA